MPDARKTAERLLRRYYNDDMMAIPVIIHRITATMERRRDNMRRWEHASDVQDFLVELY